MLFWLRHTLISVSRRAVVSKSNNGSSLHDLALHVLISYLEVIQSSLGLHRAGAMISMPARSPNDGATTQRYTNPRYCFANRLPIGDFSACKGHTRTASCLQIYGMYLNIVFCRFYAAKTICLIQRFHTADSHSQTLQSIVGSVSSTESFLGT